MGFLARARGRGSRRWEPFSQLLGKPYLLLDVNHVAPVCAFRLMAIKTGDRSQAESHAKNPRRQAAFFRYIPLGVGVWEKPGIHCPHATNSKIRWSIYHSFRPLASHEKRMDEVEPI